MQTRSQQYSQIVYGHILELKEAIDNATTEEEKSKKEKLAKQYGSLCHNFPLMVLKNGLSQAVAFVWTKSNNQPDKAHTAFLKHIASLLDFDENDLSSFQQDINGAELMEYQRHTRKVLAASIWYKRFGESLLGVKAGEDSEEEENERA